MPPRPASLEGHRCGRAPPISGPRRHAVGGVTQRGCAAARDGTSQMPIGRTIGRAGGRSSLAALARKAGRAAMGLKGEGAFGCVRERENGQGWRSLRRPRGPPGARRRALGGRYGGAAGGGACEHAGGPRWWTGTPRSWARPTKDGIDPPGAGPPGRRGCGGPSPSGRTASGGRSDGRASGSGARRRAGLRPHHQRDRGSELGRVPLRG